MRHRKLPFTVTVLLGVTLLGGASAVADTRAVSVGDMLRDYVADFRSDPFAADPITFGIRVADAERGDWHVVVGGKAEGDSAAGVTLHEGFPETPCAYFITNLDTLRKLHRGEMASLTAMGKAFTTDYAPLDVEAMDGFAPDAKFGERIVEIAFHFWTRGFPEIVRFGDSRYTRELHGGNAVLFYYQPGFRSGWFQITPGQHVNENEGSRTNPFPTMMIITRGQTKARIGGKETVLREGESVYIGKEVSHEFWNDGKQPCEGIIVMFGEGA